MRGLLPLPLWHLVGWPGKAYTAAGGYMKQPQDAAEPIVLMHEQGGSHPQPLQDRHSMP